MGAKQGMRKAYNDEQKRFDKEWALLRGSSQRDGTIRDLLIISIDKVNGKQLSEICDDLKGKMKERCSRKEVRGILVEWVKNGYLKLDSRGYVATQKLEDGREGVSDKVSVMGSSHVMVHSSSHGLMDMETYTAVMKRRIRE